VKRGNFAFFETHSFTDKLSIRVFRLSDKLQLIGSSYFQQGMRIITVFVMLRYIGPNDKGIFALVVYAAGLVMALNDFAIPQGVVQLREFGEDTVIDTAIVLTGILYGFYGLFAVGAGVFLTHRDPAHDPQYWRIAAIFGVSNFLTGLYNVQIARLNRRLQFVAESRQNIIYAVSVAVTGMVFAVLHYGAYALALQLLAGQLAANIAINFRVPLSFPRRISREVALRFLKLGVPASIAAYVRAVEASIIGLIIKPIAGTYGLGLWSTSIQFQQLFGQNLLVSFQRVAYPLLVHGLDDRERMRNLFARITLILMLISLLFTAVVGVNSEAIVRICAGPDWIAAAPLLRITAWAIPAGALDMVAYMLCMAMGVSKSFMKASLINLIVFVPAAFLVRYSGGGLMALAICWSASRYFLALTTLQLVTPRLGAGLGAIAKPLAGLTASAVASAGAMVLIRELSPHVRLPIQFVFCGFVGTVVFAGAVWIWERDTVLDAWKMARGSGTPEPTEPAAILIPGQDPNAPPEPIPVSPVNYNAPMDSSTAEYPLRRVLPRSYQALMRITRRHGMNTLSRVHAGLFPGPQRIIHRTGAEMIVPGDPHFFGYLTDHESHIAHIIRRVVRKGDTCVDVGANIGYFSTMLAGAAGKTGRVVCYEPELHNFDVLKKNSALAAQSGFTILPIRAAVSETEGTVKLSISQFSTQHRISDNGDSAGEFESVPSVNLSDDLPRRGVTGFIRFLKMDVEGHEIPALRGLSRLAGAKLIGTAVIEVESGDHAKAVEQLIAEWKASASYFLEDRWHRRPVSEIPCRTDIRIDFV
jgi:FkbM family methyltransferase